MRPARSARCGRCARPRWARRAPSASVRGSPGALAPRQPAECERAGHEDADIRPRRLVPGRLGWRCGERLRSVRGRGSNGCGSKTGPADWLPGSATPPYARRAAHAARQCRGGPPSAVGVARVATPAAKCGLASARAVQRPNQQGGGAAPAPRRLAGQRAGAGAPQRAHISSRSAGRGGEVQWRLYGTWEHAMVTTEKPIVATISYARHYAVPPRARRSRRSSRRQTGPAAPPSGQSGVAACRRAPAEHRLRAATGRRAGRGRAAPLPGAPRRLRHERPSRCDKRDRRAAVGARGHVERGDARAASASVRASPDALPPMQAARRMRTRRPRGRRCPPPPPRTTPARLAVRRAAAAQRPYMAKRCRLTQGTTPQQAVAPQCIGTGGSAHKLPTQLMCDLERGS